MILKMNNKNDLTIKNRIVNIKMCYYEMDRGYIMNKKPFYESTTFIIVMLIIAFPIGILLMWKYKKFDNAARCVISAAYAIIIFYTVISTDEVPASAVSNNEAIQISDINYLKI